jgi:hypothetical protein
MWKAYHNELKPSIESFMLICVEGVYKIYDGCKTEKCYLTLVLKIGTTFLTAALRKTEATHRSAQQLPQQQGKERVFSPAMFA